jgi:hypothetical protein
VKTGLLGMSKLLNDHQDSDHFTYSRNWVEIETMLDKAESVKHKWELKYYVAKENNNTKEAIRCARNMKALEGVIKTLRWTLGDINISHPLN